MRINFINQQKSWRISGMEPVHVHLLEQVAEDASMTDCPQGRARLLPRPVLPQDELREGEFLEDWSDYVTEELDTQFAEDVGLMLSDLDGMESYFSNDPSKELRFRVDIPVDNGTAWFSALNQARLMLDLKYQLHPDGNDFVPNPSEEVLQGIPAHERLGAFMRYEFYAYVQEWIVRNIFK